MPLYELTHDALTELPRTTMVQQDFKERADLQRLLKTSIGIIDANLLLLAEEFSQWEDSKRRIDLLALDKQANLVVIELKRTEDGGFMDLQSIRYAAMVSAMTFQQAAYEHAKFLGDPANVDDAKSRILEFLGWEAPTEDFASRVRIILTSADFSPELTTAVLWLNDNGLDIRCVRLRPYALQSRTILEAQQIIPIPEAKDITVRLKEKQEEIRQVKQSKWNIDFSRYDLTVGSEVFRNLWKRGLAWQVVRSSIDEGIDFEWLKSQLTPYRLFALDGELSSEDFLKATAAVKAPGRAPFDKGRFFTDDGQLFKVQGKTYALTNQWSIASFPLLDEIIGQLPSGSMSYSKTEVGIS
jgi:hypothetical protein